MTGKRNGTPKEITTLADVRPQQRNANKHTQRGMGMLENAMRELGYTSPMTAAADGEIFDGSARLEKSADVFGVDVEPIIVHSDGTRPIIHVRDDIPTADDPRAIRASLGANQIAAANLDYDAEVLAGLLAEDEALLAGLFERDELAEIMAGIEQDEPPDDPGGQIDRAEELREKWQTATGDLWALGEHRLVCGDCTDAAVVERVMGGERAALVFTSPPYNQSLLSQSSPTGMHRANKWFRGLEDAYSDSMPESDYQEWQICVLNLWFNCVADGGALFYNHKHRYRDRRPIIPLDWIRKTKWELRQEIIWDRRGGVAANAGMFIPGDERLYWLEKEGAHVWNGVGRNITTVWVISPQANDGTHVCPFPVDLLTAPIECVSNPGDIVADPFAGSGTTGIACERLGRKARMVEISPAYCAVILERWATMTGRTPERIGGA